MGIDIHALNFLKYASKGRRLNRVATIGRQALTVPLLAARFGPHCEEFLLRDLGATLVDSYDYSDYEGATRIVDLNEPLPETERYDTVLDCGSLEHVFNAPQALKNISALCSVGGQIIHVLPANNFCGHGFWQFSPELFFSLYSEENGYTATEVFLADLGNARTWYQVTRPCGRRAEITSKSRVYVMCKTSKKLDCPRMNVQQSDYIPLWKAKRQPNQAGFAAGLKRAIKKNPLLFRWASGLRKATNERLQLLNNPTSLSRRNRHLKKCNVAALLKE